MRGLNLDGIEAAKVKRRKAGKKRRYRQDRTSSIAAVAKRAGVSIATVSRVTSGATQLVRKSTADRVKAAIQELNYRPQLAGPTLRTQKTPIIAVLVPDVSNIMGAIASSVEAALWSEKQVMFLCNTHEDPALQDEYLQEIRSYLVGGIVIIGAVASPVLETFIKAGERIVFAIRKSPVGMPAPYVGIDQYLAGRDVAAHFIAQGHRRPGMIHGPAATGRVRIPSPPAASSIVQA